MDILDYEQFIFTELYENKYVTPGNEANPRFGWAIIMAGGPGSGKGWSISNKLLVQGKHFDVDKFKQNFIKFQEREKGYSEYDLKNPDDVAALHRKFTEKHFKEKEREYFAQSLGNTERLPNIIFDITAKNTEDIESVIGFIKDHKINYKVALVWVAINRSVAMYNNFNPKRGRVVPERVFHEIHNSVNATMLNLLTTYRSYGIDEFWCVKNSTNTLAEMDYDAKGDPTGIPSNNVINISNATAGDIADIKSLIGLYEPNPNNPINYMPFAELENIPRKDQAKFTNFYKK